MTGRVSPPVTLERGKLCLLPLHLSLNPFPRRRRDSQAKHFLSFIREYFNPQKNESPDIIYLIAVEGFRKARTVFRAGFNCRMEFAIEQNVFEHF